MTVFDWHPKARLVAPDGTTIGREPGDLPAALSEVGIGRLSEVLKGEGRAFRIGGQGELEAQPGEFETLTGGSLGSPRRVIRSQQSWTSSFTVDAGLFDIGSATNVAIVGSLVHSLALYGAVEALHLGATLHLLHPMRPDRQAQAIADRRVDVLYVTPAQLRQLVSHAPIWPHLRVVLVGGSKVDTALRAAVQKSAPNAKLREFYGAAETSFVTLSTEGDATASVGRAYPGVDLSVDSDGLIWVRSPYLFRDYAGLDRGSACWQKDWLTVGEAGEMTPDGLVLRGRAGRMVTIADTNIFPDEIEIALLGLLGIEKAAILPVQNTARGHVLVAFFAGNPAHESDIRAFLLQRLGPTAAPKAIFWPRHWPTLPSGKTDLAALQTEADKWRS